jgi:hypothetical protein
VRRCAAAKCSGGRLQRRAVAAADCSGVRWRRTAAAASCSCVWQRRQTAAVAANCSGGELQRPQTAAAAAENCSGGDLQRHAVAADCGGGLRRCEEVEVNQWPCVTIVITFRSEDLLFSVLWALRTVHYVCLSVVNVLLQLPYIPGFKNHFPPNFF